MSAQQCLLETTDPSQTPQLNQVFPFTIVNVTYSLQGLMTIRRLMMRGIIFAMRESVNGDFAQYSGSGSTLDHSPMIRVGFDELGTDDTRESRKGLLLHECIHAMQDNRAAVWMRVDTAEAAAYTAQCLFHRACGRPRGELSELVAAAWDAAEAIRTSSTRSVAESDIQGLLSAIRGHPTYREIADITGRYDGIARPPQRQQSRGGCNCSVSAFPSRSRVAQLVRILGL